MSPQNSSPRNTYIVMTVGGLLVLGLVAWALMRSFQAPVGPTPEPPQTGATAAPAPEPEPHVQDAAHAAVPRISVEDLRQKVARSEVTVIDVRDADAYLAAHIPGSLHIPLARIEGEIPYLPREKPIVTYCT
jgi:Rhodanese-like domain